MFSKTKTLNARPFELTVDRLLANDQHRSSEQPTKLGNLPNWLPIGGDNWLFCGQLSTKCHVDILIDALTGEDPTS